MADIALPKGNEKEFIKIASALGIKELLFVYKTKKDVSALQKTTDIKLSSGTLTPEKSNFIVAKSAKNDRELIERGRIKLLFGLEQSGRGDFIHHRNSGLNQVLCKIASKNKVSVGLSFESILLAPRKKRAEILGRMMQNVRLCRKYKVPITIASFASHPLNLRSHSDLISFGITIGMTEKEAKDSFITLNKR